MRSLVKSNTLLIINKECLTTAMSSGTSRAAMLSDMGTRRRYDRTSTTNLLQELLGYTLGYTIHPNILTKGNLPSNPRIADVGADIGQWLIDISMEIPSAQLDGFDIARDQYPNKTWLPSQILLHELNIKKVIQPSTEGTHDVAHV
ncbi:hypothetical protein N7G274_009649 [Stereocaulon virgatum]|uniref:LAGLIDADG homing endonuclease n=1 Tax=Stereocaulon virgatum TaxID=373712 RepID=A0ABR3ZX12_9LECA